MEESRETSMFRAEIIDHGGLKPPAEEPESPLDTMKKLRKRRSEEEIDIVEEEVVEENNILDQWIIETTVCFYLCLFCFTCLPVYITRVY